MPDHIVDMILDAAKEGFKVETNRIKLASSSGGFSTMVKLSHPSGVVLWSETGYPDFFDPETARAAFEGQKYFIMNGKRRP